MAKDTSSKRKINLATAKTADAALPAPKSAYEICGFNDSAFGNETFEQFQAKIRGMDLYTLQSYAQRVGVVPTSRKDTVIDRLERRFLQDRSRNGPPRTVAQGSTDPELREQALRILARGK